MRISNAKLWKVTLSNSGNDVMVYMVRAEEASNALFLARVKARQDDIVYNGATAVEEK